MWLLDVNLPLKLAAVLSSYGIQCETAESRDWKKLKNGDLVQAAANAGFTCILTRDKFFNIAATKALRANPTIAIVLIRLPQLREPEYLQMFKKAWEKQSIQPKVGQALLWPK